MVRKISERLGLPVAVLMDLPGPKYRTGPLKDDSQIAGGNTVIYH